MEVFQYIFRYTNIADISDSDHQTKKDVHCSIATLKTVSFGTNKSGKLLTGICEDDTGCITYCAWHENAKLFNDKLKVGNAYMLQNVTVYICKPRFALTPKKLQLIFDDKTIVVPSNDSKSYKSPLNLTQVKDVAQISDGDTKCNIAGNIIEKQWQDVKPTYTEDKESVESNHLKLKIRDAEADIDISFFGEKARSFYGEIGDLLLLRNTSAKVFGSYHVIQGNMGSYSINPNYQDLDHLSNLHIGPDAAIHMSPKKKETKQTTINEPNENAEKQNFHATVIDIPMVKTYPKCPMVGCRKSLYYNENTNTYSCDSCVKKYYVSAKCLTIKVTVEEDNASKDITFFNESAEKFLNATAEDILKDTEKIVEKVIGDRYSFVVKVGKLKNEYICVASNLITKKQDDSKFQDIIS